MTRVVPIFVLGAPRSGTGVIAAFIASSAGILNLFEYGGFYWSGFWGEKLLFRYGGENYKEDFIRNSIIFVDKFASDLCSGSGLGYYVDSTPGNLLVVPRLAKILPHAVFVLVLRRPIEVVCSLRKSFEAGHEWAGRDVRERAELWRTFYAYALSLPRERTIAISYDALCRQPETVLDEFCEELKAFEPGFSPSLVPLTVPHHGGAADKTLAVHSNGRLTLRSIPRLAIAEMPDAAVKEIDCITSDVHQLLQMAHPAKYRD